MLRKFFKQQKGAMFGLDARIALSIFAGLSIIAGSAIVFTARDAQSQALLTDLAAIRDAVDNFQSDTEMSLHDALTDESDINAFLALVDPSVLTPEASRHWLGPYLNKIRSAQHPDYGTMSISEENKFYWLYISDVPIQTIEDLDSAFDSSELSNPNSTGVLRWNAATNQVRWILGSSF